MITANVLTRVFHVLYNGRTATAFTIEVDDRQYLVTARHTVASMPQSSAVQIMRNDAWIELPVSPIWIDPPEIDVAILCPSYQVSRVLPLEPSLHGIINGQDLYFVGFPYGQFSPDHGDYNQGYPFPLIKKGILSAIFKNPQGIRTLILDGHNNPGFSGGPIVFAAPGTNNYKVGGVISGYQQVEEPIYDGGTETSMTWRYNTGIIEGYDIAHAVEAIRADPRGALVTDFQ